jgi:mono/diheme cytochrome c family protein
VESNAENGGWSVKRFLLLVAVVLAGCGGSPRRSETVQGQPAPISTPKQVAGERVFMKNCNQCHPLGEGGVGAAINNKPFPSAMLKAKVRTGLGGDMPGFSEKDVSPTELDELVAYLEALRSNHPQQ